MHPLDPVLHNVTNENIYEWRQFLKRQLCVERNWKSDWSGIRLVAGDMHEGILTRGNVPKSLDWQWKIFHPFNCVLLLSEEHIPFPPSRAWCAKCAFDRYGKENVVDWYYSLPFKRFPFRIEELDNLRAK